MKKRPGKIARAIAWGLIGSAPLAAFYGSQAANDHGTRNWIQAAWTDLLPATADAAPPANNPRTGAGGRGGALTPAQQRRQRLLVAQFLHRQELLSPAQQQADRLQFLQSEQMEWAKFREFANLNTPKLAAQLGALAPTAPLRVGLMQRWLNMEQLRENNQTELYDLNVNQFRHEDTVRSLTKMVQTADHKGDAAAMAQVTARIHAEVASLVGINLNQRDLQIKNAQRLLDEAKEKLKTDRQNEAQLINDKTDDIVQQVKNADLAQSSVAPPAEAPPPELPQLDGQPLDNPAPGAP